VLMAAPSLGAWFFLSGYGDRFRRKILYAQEATL
jgi:hypothetical protein